MKDHHLADMGSQKLPQIFHGCLRDMVFQLVLDSCLGICHIFHHSSHTTNVCLLSPIPEKYSKTHYKKKARTVDFRVSKYKQIILGNPPCQNIMDFQCFRNCHCPNRRRLMPNCTKHVTVIAVYSHSFT